FFYFTSRRRHTIFSRDWSSDVCSSDLGDGHTRLAQRDRDTAGADRELERGTARGELGEQIDRRPQHLGGEHAQAGGVVLGGGLLDRKIVVQGKELMKIDVHNRDNINAK